MWEQISEILNGFNTISILVRLLLAMIFGGIVGIERGIRRRPAGFRTYMLVCVGSALVMMTNEFINIKFGGSDPARMGAQVVNGIGFLGAGTIIVTRHHQVKGLTTAAGLWASACAGLAIGIGFYQGAIISSVLIFLIITFLHSVDSKMAGSTRSMDMFVEFTADAKVSDFLSAVISQKIKVLHVEIVQPRSENYTGLAAIVSIRLPKRFPHYDVVNNLKDIYGVSYLEEV